MFKREIIFKRCSISKNGHLIGFGQREINNRFQVANVISVCTHFYSIRFPYEHISVGKSEIAKKKSFVSVPPFILDEVSSSDTLVQEGMRVALRDGYPGQEGMRVALRYGYLGAGGDESCTQVRTPWSRRG